MKEIYPLGILAGMGPYSTAPFLNHVLDACKKLYGAGQSRTLKFYDSSVILAEKLVKEYIIHRAK